MLRMMQIVALLLLLCMSSLVQAKDARYVTCWVNKGEIRCLPEGFSASLVLPSSGMLFSEPEYFLFYLDMLKHRYPDETIMLEEYVFQEKQFDRGMRARYAKLLREHGYPFRGKD